MMKFPTEWKKTNHVPNHQPVISVLCFKSDYSYQMGVSNPWGPIYGYFLFGGENPTNIDDLGVALFQGNRTPA
jgi:hypothetical protein